MDIANLYDEVARSMAFKGKAGEHKAATEGANDVLRAVPEAQKSEGQE